MERTGIHREKEFWNDADEEPRNEWVTTIEAEEEEEEKKSAAAVVVAVAQ